MGRRKGVSIEAQDVAVSMGSQDGEEGNEHGLTRWERKE